MMSREGEYIEDLIGAISEGREVDWVAEERAATGTNEARVIRQLALIAYIADANRRLRSNPEEVPFPTWRHLRLLARIGSGRFGEVFRAYDETLHQAVALKLYHADSSDIGSLPEVIAEARALARIRHENVVRIHGFDVDHGRVGFWMDLVEGENLAQLLERSHILGPRQVAELGVAMCRALEAAHSAGVLHGDIKPSNVLCLADGRYCLVDFGAGRIVTPNVPGTHHTGTPFFMAPETLTLGRLTERSDVYSLGVLLFYALTGRHPVEADAIETLKHAHADRVLRTDTEDLADSRFPSLRVLRADIPQQLARCIARCLSADPEARYPQVGDLEKVLQRSTARSRAATALWLLAAGTLALAALTWVLNSRGASVSLSLDSLPSRQGWAYSTTGVDVGTPEASVFTVSDGVLVQDSMGQGFGHGEIQCARPVVLNEAEPMVLEIRARLTNIEGYESNGCYGYGFNFGLCTGKHLYQFGMMPDRIRDDCPISHDIVFLDTTVFHDYRIEMLPSGTARFFVDGALKTVTSGHSRDIAAKLFLGDGTGTTNARAEVASYRFTQSGSPLPAALSVALLAAATGMAGVGAWMSRRVHRVAPGFPHIG